MSIEDLAKDLALEQMQSPEFLDKLTDEFIRALEASWNPVVYFKDGLLPEGVIDAAFNHLQERSLSEQLCLGRTQIKVFYIPVDKDFLGLIGNREDKQGFYKKFSRRLIAFLDKALKGYESMIAQCESDSEREYLLDAKKEYERMNDGIKKRFSKELGIEGVSDDEVYLHNDRLFRPNHSFSRALIRFLGDYFIDTDIEIPLLVPVFNFKCPETLTGEEAEEAVKALESYKSGEQPSSIVKENGTMFGFVSTLLVDWCLTDFGFYDRPRLIVAAPLYCLKAVPDSKNTEPWIVDPLFSNGGARMGLEQCDNSSYKI